MGYRGPDEGSGEGLTTRDPGKRLHEVHSVAVEGNRDPAGTVFWKKVLERVGFCSRPVAKQSLFSKGRALLYIVLQIEMKGLVGRFYSLRCLVTFGVRVGSLRKDLVFSRHFKTLKHDR